jgi:large subunit ribosomal protein L25
MLSCRDMTVTLPIKSRSKEDKAVKLNLKESIPGIIYGPKQEPISVVVNRKDFEKTFKTAGEATVISLQGLPKTVDVLVKDVTFAPIKGGIVHIDFYALEKGKEIVTHVPLHFIGEAPVAKLGAVVNKVIQEVTVSCQAADLPAHIDVDLALLTELEAKIKVGDLVAPKGVKITEAEDVVVAIAEAVEEEVIEEAPAVAMTDIPVEQKGKVEAE